MHNITVTVEKENEFGKMDFDTAYLDEIGREIAHTVTPREPHISVQHCNLAIELRELKTMKYTEVIFDNEVGVKRLGNVGDIDTQGRRVYDKEAISPSLLAGMEHGNTVPYITEEKTIKIRQATEQGYALCEIGGGSGLKLSNKPNKKGKGNRERKDLPDLDCGVYP